MAAGLSITEADAITIGLSGRFVIVVRDAMAAGLAIAAENGIAAGLAIAECDAMGDTMLPSGLVIAAGVVI